MDNFGYYVAGLILLIVGFLVMKKVASCMIKTVVTLVLVAVLVAVYYLYLR
ncbi:MAG: sulfate transporter [Prevotella sp.]|nr:sulfate transporter [Prevotella sp.]